MSYQDQWRDGKLHRRGYRDCEKRYALIRQHIAPLGTKFTVLDVGAAEGYFAVRLAEDFQANVTAVEPRPVKSQSQHPRVRWIQSPFIQPLGTFDVVLALSLLHHIHAWRATLTLLLHSMNRFLFVETPHPREQLRAAPAKRELGAIDTELQLQGGIRIGEFPGVWDASLLRGLYLFTR